MSATCHRLLLPVLAVLALVLPARAQTILGPLPYLSFNDSPFKNLGILDYFHLEDFEDDAFNVPGVTASNGQVIGFEDWGGLVDGVDADDGVIDGTAIHGRNFFNTSGSVTFTFNAGILGTLPTHVGIVWTDGGDPTFEAFGAGNVPLGSVTGAHKDGNNSGGTAEDRFYGVIHPGGVQSIKITAATWELDHLQFGVLSPVPVPEPSVALLLAAGAAVLWSRRRQG